jgi:hypothetical protein
VVDVLTAGEGPAALVTERVDDRHADDVFETLQPAADDRALRPGACPRDVEVVAADLRRKGGGAVGRDDIAEAALLALELAVDALVAERELARRDRRGLVAAHRASV